MKELSTSEKILACIAAASLLLHLAASFFIDPFIDEALTWFVSENSPGSILTHDLNEPMLPFWYLVIHAFRYLGTSVFFLRLPSALAGAASVYVTYLIGCRLKDSRLGLWAAGISAVSYPMLLSSCQIRVYGFLALALSASVYFALDFYLEDRQRTAMRTAAFSVSVFFCGCCHYLGTVSAAALCLWLACLPAGRKDKWKGAVLCLTGISVSIGYFFYGASHSGAGFVSNAVSKFNNVSIVPQLPAHCAGLATLGDILATEPGMEAFGPLWFSAELVLNILLWMALAVSVKCAWNKDKYLAVLGIIIPGAPLAALTLGSLMGMQPVQPRYFAPYTGFFALWCAVFLCGPAAGAGWKRTAALAVVGTNLLMSVSLSFAPRLWNQHWSGVVSFINSSRTSPNDSALLYIPYTVFAFAANYAPGQIHYVIGDNPGQDRFVPDESYRGMSFRPLALEMLTPEFFASLKDGSVFLIMNQHEVLGENAGEIMTILDSRYEIDREFHVSGTSAVDRIDAYRLRPKNGQSLPEKVPQRQ